MGRGAKGHPATASSDAAEGEFGNAFPKTRGLGALKKEGTCTTAGGDGAVPGDVEGVGRRDRKPGDPAQPGDGFRGQPSAPYGPLLQMVGIARLFASVCPMGRGGAGDGLEHPVGEG